MKYKYIINPSYESLTDFVEKVPQKFDREGMLIHDSYNTVRIFKVDGDQIVVKRFRRTRRIPKRFAYTFVRPSRAKRAYNNALKLKELNISTPEPIACIEEYHFGLFRQGYTVYAYCGDSDARILRDEPEGHDDLINAVAHFLVNMHEKGFFHGDTNLSNFLYRKDKTSPTGYHITTIGITHSLFVDNPSREDCIRNLMRLTHIRPTLKKIIGRYAELRGWNAEWAISLAIQKLDAFEKNIEMKKKNKK